MSGIDIAVLCQARSFLEDAVDELGGEDEAVEADGCAGVRIVCALSCLRELTPDVYDRWRLGYAVGRSEL